MAEALTLNGVSLDTYAFALQDISGLMTSPALRGDNITVPGRHGVIVTSGKRFDATEIVLPLWIIGAQPDGSIPEGSSEAAEFFARRDELLRLLYADPLIIQFTRPGGHAVQARAEVADVLDFTRRFAEPIAQVSVALSLPDAFWQDALSVSQTITGESGTEQPLTAFEGSTAPVSDLLITFRGPVNNPMLTHGDRWVKFHGAIDEGRQVQLNTETWSISPGSGDIWAPDVRQVEFGRPPIWLELDPATKPFSVTFTHTTGAAATCTIAGRRKYLSP